MSSSISPRCASSISPAFVQTWAKLSLLAPLPKVSVFACVRMRVSVPNVSVFACVMMGVLSRGETLESANLSIACSWISNCVDFSERATLCGLGVALPTAANGEPMCSSNVDKTDSGSFDSKGSSHFADLSLAVCKTGGGKSSSLTKSLAACLTRQSVSLLSRCNASAAEAALCPQL